VKAGDRVAVVGPNCHRYLELYQAITGAGMALVPLNQRHTPTELDYALEDSGTKVLFAGAGLDVPRESVEQVIDLGDGYEELIADAPDAECPDTVTEDTLAGLFYTGGDDRRVEGREVTHRNLVANAMHFQVCWPFDPDTCWLIVAPLFHLAGSIAVLSTVWNAGRQIVLPAFDPAGVLDLIERERVTATLVVPTMLAALSDEQLARPRDVSTLRLISHGGAPIATQTLLRAQGVPRSAADAHLRRDGDRADRDRAPTRGARARRPAGPLVRPAGGRGRGRRDWPGRPPGSDRNRRRGRRSRPERDGRLLEQAAADGRGARRRLVPHRRPRLPRRAGLPLPRGPCEGHDRDRRRERVLDRVEDVLFRHDAVLEAAVFGIPTRAGARPCTRWSCSGPRSRRTSFCATAGRRSPPTRCRGGSSSHGAGYPTQRTRAPGERLTHGFYFGLGHGVGLEAHESPWLGLASNETLVAGDVVAIEPGIEGLEGIGGVRFEDLLLITDDGCETLTRYPYDL
jgi:AMP-binding enzyme/Metallopeptidase family M24